MKQLCVIALTIVGICAMIMVAQAAEVTLAWDPNNPDPDGYNLYQRLDGEVYDYSTPVNADLIPAPGYIVKGLTPGVEYFFVVHAVVGDGESGDSNEVSYTAAAESSCLNITHPDGTEVENIQAGAYVINGYPDLLAIIWPVPEEMDNPPYSTNRSKTIYHRSDCRYHDPERGIADPAECASCRPCKICGVE